MDTADASIPARSKVGRLQLLLVSQEIMRLVDASREGRLNERGRTEQFDGAYGEMIQGINDMLDAILLPIGEGNRILAQISNGKIDELIAQTYKGDHEKMKLAVNNGHHRTKSGKGNGPPHRGFQGWATRPIAANLNNFKGLRRDRARRKHHAGRDPALPIGEGNRILGQISNGKIDELIASNLQRRPRKMKLAVNNVAR